LQFAGKMKRFRTIPHTADVGLVAYGSNLAEAYANAAYGMFSVIANLRNVRELEIRHVELTETSPEELLFEWLNRLIYHFDAEMLLLREFEVTHLDDRNLKAICRGEKYDPLRHQIKLGVKAATYYMLKVDRSKNQVRVILDI
jgi:SHS2 domain-containing protein